MAGLSIGSTPIADVELGSTPVQKVYLGATEVWAKENILYEDGPPAVKTGDWSLSGCTISTDSGVGIRFTSGAFSTYSATMSVSVTSGKSYRVTQQAGAVTNNNGAQSIGIYSGSEVELYVNTLTPNELTDVVVVAIDGTLKVRVGGLGMSGIPGQDYQQMQSLLIKEEFA